MRSISDSPIPKLDGSALDLGLTPEQLAVREQVREFSRTVLRPAGAAVDKLTAIDAVKPESPWYTAFQEFVALGLDLELMYFNEDHSTANTLKSIGFEELGWGDPGLTLTFALASFPAIFARKLGRPDLAEELGDKLGCWNASQRTRGSELADIHGTETAGGFQHQVPDLAATKVEGGYVLRGRSSAWVSNAPLAQTAFSHFPLVDKNGVPQYNDKGVIGMITAIHPLDVEGVTIGPALEKFGLRPDPTGYLDFNDVFLPDNYVVGDETQTPQIMMTSATEVSLTIASVFTGVARAAYEHVQAYSHERVQVGRPLVEHQAVKMRLFRDFQKVEACRAMSRHAWHSAAVAKEAHPLISFTAKTYCTETAFEVATSAQQGMGANGLALSFPMEKLLRDCRAAVIADGENNIQALLSGSYLMGAFRETPPASNTSYVDTYPLFESES